MSEEAKAVQELAKTSSKAIDAGEKMGSFISRFIGGPLEQASGIWEDKLKYIRWERQIRLMERAEGFLRERGLQRPTKAIPLQIAVPLIQGGSLEEDDYLQDLWAAMLANAADETSEIQVRRAYLSILEDLTTLDVNILNTVYQKGMEIFLPSSFRDGFYIGYFPDEAKPLDQFPDQPIPDINMDVMLSVANLTRLGLLREFVNVDGVPNRYEVEATELGEAFFRACSVESSAS